MKRKGSIRWAGRSATSNCRADSRCQMPDASCQVVVIDGLCSGGKNEDKAVNMEGLVA